MDLFEQLLPDDNFALFKTIICILAICECNKEMSKESFWSMQSCLFFHLKPLGIKTVDFKMVPSYFNDVFSLIVDNQDLCAHAGSIKSLNTIHCISHVLHYYANSIEETPQSFALFELRENQHKNMEDKIKQIDALWENYKPYQPLSLQNQCGQVIRDNMRSRMDMPSLGLPEEILSFVIKADIGEILWAIMTE